MARVNVEERAFTDPRISALSMAIGFDVLGPLPRIWHLAGNRRSVILPANWIDGAAGIRGFADKLVESGLGSIEPDGIRVKGAEAAVAWLIEQDAKSRAGVLARKAKRLGQPKQEPSQPTGQPTGEPSVSASASDSASDSKDLKAKAGAAPADAGSTSAPAEKVKKERKPQVWYESTKDIIVDDEYDRLRELHSDLTEDEFDKILLKSEDIFVTQKERRTRNGVIKWAGHFLANEKHAVKSRRKAAPETKKVTPAFEGFSREEAANFLKEVDRRIDGKSD